MGTLPLRTLVRPRVRLARTSFIARPVAAKIRKFIFIFLHRKHHTQVSGLHFQFLGECGPDLANPPPLNLPFNEGRIGSFTDAEFNSCRKRFCINVKGPGWTPNQENSLGTPPARPGGRTQRYYGYGYNTE